MGAIGTFFRAHRWQRRALTVLVAVTVGVAGAVFLRPPIREYYLLRDLGSGDPKVREAAVVRGVRLGRLYPHVVKRLNEALATEDDQEFYTITRVLDGLGVFRVAGRDPSQIDRRTLIEFVTTRSPQSKAAAVSQQTATSQAGSQPALTDIAADTRLLLFQGAVFIGRDNPYTRRLLAAAAGDESSAIRQASAVLAARFADANTLQKLLADPDPNVIEWAAIDAGLAKVTELADPIAGLMTVSENADVVSACARGLACFDPNTTRWPAILLEVMTPDNMDRVLSAAIPGRAELNASAGCLRVPATRLSGERRYPPVMMLRLFAEDAPDECGPLINQVLDGAIDPNSYKGESADKRGPTRGQMMAALEGADQLKLPIRRQTNAILRDLWQPDMALTLTAAARVLGRQIDANQGGRPDAPSPEQCIQTLREAALFEPPEDPNDLEFALAVPSAAAAVALWRREPSASFVLSEPSRAGTDENAPDSGTRFDANSAAYLIYLTSCSKHQLPPDYISWHLARSGRPKAFDLGMNLLPPPPDPRVPATRRGFRNYSVNSRQTAAMLLALSARTPDQKKAAIARITARLEGGPLGAPTNFYEIGTCQCALLILGDANFRQNVEGLLATGAFPARRAITALCAAGTGDANAGRAALDWLLWDTQAPASEITDILVGTGLEEVLQVLVPELPAVDAAAGDDLRNWQVRIMQDYYRIHREKIRFAPWQ